MRKIVCMYCGGMTLDDSRGNCLSCGAPRKESSPIPDYLPGGSCYYLMEDGLGISTFIGASCPDLIIDSLDQIIYHEDRIPEEYPRSSLKNIVRMSLGLPPT